MKWIPSSKNFFILLGLILGAGFMSGCSSLHPVDSGKRGLFDRSSSRPLAYHKRSVKGGAIPKVVAASEEKDEKPDPKLKNVAWSWPVDEAEVTSPFGQRGKEFHEGIDLRAPSGTAVYAAQGGIVMYSDSKIRGYGKLVVIKHDQKTATIYAHNSKLLVRRGDRVKKGQLIAKSGQTGHVTGPHVHFEIRQGVLALNPLLYLPKPAALQAQNPHLHTVASTTGVKVNTRKRPKRSHRHEREVAAKLVSPRSTMLD